MVGSESSSLDLADASSGMKGNKEVRFGKCTPVSIVKSVNRLRTDFYMKGKLEQRKSSQLVFEGGWGDENLVGTLRKSSIQLKT